MAKKTDTPHKIINKALISIKVSVPMKSKALDEVADLNAKLKDGVATLAGELGITPDEITTSAKLVRARVPSDT